MMRKSRFGSKAGRGEDRGAVEGASQGPDGSDSSDSDAESENVEEGVDRYERSSDRYRAEKNERAGAEGSTPARRALGGGFSKGGGSSTFSKSRGSKGSSFSRGNVSGNSTFSRGAGSRGLSESRDAKEDAVSENVTQDAEPQAVYERSSERSSERSTARRGLANRSSFGRSAGKENATNDNATNDNALAAPSDEAVYERSSDRKFGRGSSTGRGSSFTSSSSKRDATPDSAVFERSSERNSGRGKARRPSKPGDEQSGAEGSVEKNAPVDPAKNTAADPALRLERARVALQEAVAKPKAKGRVTGQGLPEVRVDIPDPFEAADPFEPFEQCAPAETLIAETPIAESTYSRAAQDRKKSSPTEESKRKRPQLSLRGRALGYLSRREHSRAELSRKLMPHAGEADSLETLLDTLEQEGWLSNARFVESVVHRRGGRLGASRIVNELKRHAVGDALIQETGAELSKTDLARAREVWERKYGEPPGSPAERAKQARFLAARGFSSGTIMKVLKGNDEDWAGEPSGD
jgi:SOS response regulatory protein OraA/RecX